MEAAPKGIEATRMTWAPSGMPVARIERSRSAIISSVSDGADASRGATERTSARRLTTLSSGDRAVIGHPGRSRARRRAVIPLRV